MIKRQSILALAIIVILAGSSRAFAYSGGNGSAENPYRISDANDMNEIGLNTADWNKHFVLTDDINLAQFTGTEFNIIGPNNFTPFTGVFDGNGHTIFDFTYESNETEYIGLFGHIRVGFGGNGDVKDLGLIDPNVNAGTGNCVGALVGRLNGGSITGCYVEGGRISGNFGVGGLVGQNRDYGTITRCYSTASVSGIGKYTGALVGHNLRNGTVSKCYSTGSVLGDDRVGGLVGWNNVGAISNCYSMASVSGNIRIGGLVGLNQGTITNCYSTGSVLGTTEVGGLTGDGNGVEDSFWDTETSGQTTSDGGIGKTTAEMKQKPTFTNWDFVVTWGIEDNQTYPFLRLTYPVGDLDLDKDVDFLDFAHFAAHWLEGTLD